MRIEFEVSSVSKDSKKIIALSNKAIGITIYKDRLDKAIDAVIHMFTRIISSSKEANAREIPVKDIDLSKLPHNKVSFELSSPFLIGEVSKLINLNSYGKTSLPQDETLFNDDKLQGVSGYIKNSQTSPSIISSYKSKKEEAKKEALEAIVSEYRVSFPLLNEEYRVHRLSLEGAGGEERWSVLDAIHGAMFLSRQSRLFTKIASEEDLTEEFSFNSLEDAFKTLSSAIEDAIGYIEADVRRGAREVYYFDNMVSSTDLKKELVYFKNNILLPLGISPHRINYHIDQLAVIEAALDERLH